MINGHFDWWRLPFIYQCLLAICVPGWNLGRKWIHPLLIRICARLSCSWGFFFFFFQQACRHVTTTTTCSFLFMPYLPTRRSLWRQVRRQSHDSKFSHCFPLTCYLFVIPTVNQTAAVKMKMGFMYGVIIQMDFSCYGLCCTDSLRLFICPRS